MSEYQECHVDIGRYLCPKHWEERYGEHPTGVTFTAKCWVCDEIEADRTRHERWLKESEGDTE